jgi:hypothetical protein
VAGFDRNGNKVADFARLERDRLHAPAPRPAGFLDLNDENFEETAILLFIQEREAGIIHETDNFEDLLTLRFPGFRGGDLARGGGRGRGRGRAGTHHGWARDDGQEDREVVEFRVFNPGLRGRGRGHGRFGANRGGHVEAVQGHQVQPADHHHQDDNNNHGEGANLRAEPGGWGNNHDQEDTDHGEEPDQIEAFGDLNPVAPAVLDPDPNADDELVPFDGQGGQMEEPNDMQASDNEQNAFENRTMPGLDAHGAFDVMGDIPDDNHILDDTQAGNAVLGAGNAESGVDNEPQAPTAAQIHCQHNWDLAAPGNPCKACTLTCEDHAMICTTCSVKACGECCQNFAANVQLNWPSASEDGGLAMDEEAREEQHGG